MCHNIDKLVALSELALLQFRYCSGFLFETWEGAVMPGARVKTRTLTLFLLKEHIQSAEEAIKKDSGAERHELSPELPYTGALYVGCSSKHPPGWLSYVNAGLVSPANVPDNVSTSSVLLINTASRWFAFAFGYGRHLLDPGSYEIDFGLKVALNTVDADRLRSVDVRTYEELALHTRRQASRGSSLDTFGLDVSRDLLRAVTGEPSDKALAKRVTGADSLAFTAPIRLLDLGDKCSKMLEAYGGKQYKERFGWVDHLKRVRDKDLRGKLIERLVDALKTDDTGRLYLAPPGIVDWQKAEFAFTTMPAEADRLHDLDLQDYLKSVPNRNGIDYIKLIKDRVKCCDGGSGQVICQWPVFDCMVFETDLDEDTYALVDSEWYKISKGFVNSVNAYVADIPKPDLELPPALKDEREKAYNLRLVNALPKAVFMGCKCPAPSGAHSTIEVCDVFTGESQFIHVKRSNVSSTLSHLFAQGVNSAHAFLGDAGYRRRAREYIEQANALDLAPLIPDDPPDRSKYEIVYVVIGKNGGNVDSLPFFSKLSLKQATEQLRMLGLRVSATKVGGN